MEQRLESLQFVAAQALGSKRLEKLAQSVAKNFKPTSVSSLEKANDLAFRLYVINRKDLAMLVCKELDQIKFDNNYNVWTWVELALALEARMLTEERQDKQAEECVKKIRAPFEVGDETLKSIKSKALNRRLNGDLLPFDKITESQQDNDISLEMDYRFAALKELIYLSELGGSEEFTIKNINQQIQDNLSKIKIM